MTRPFSVTKNPTIRASSSQEEDTKPSQKVDLNPDVKLAKVEVGKEKAIHQTVGRSQKRKNEALDPICKHSSKKDSENDEQLMNILQDGMKDLNVASSIGQNDDHRHQKSKRPKARVALVPRSAPKQGSSNLNFGLEVDEFLKAVARVTLGGSSLSANSGVSLRGVEKSNRKRSNSSKLEGKRSKEQRSTAKVKKENEKPSQLDSIISSGSTSVSTFETYTPSKRIKSSSVEKTEMRKERDGLEKRQSEKSNSEGTSGKLKASVKAQILQKASTIQTSRKRANSSKTTERNLKIQASKRSRSATSRKRSTSASHMCYMQAMGINHYAICNRPSSSEEKPSVPVNFCEHKGKKKRIAQVFLCSECASVVERGGVFKAFNACLLRQTSPKKLFDGKREPSTTNAVTYIPPYKCGETANIHTSGESALKRKRGSQVANEKEQTMRKPRHSRSKSVQMQWELLPTKNMELKGCLVRVNQEDSLRARGWETWLLHPDAQTVKKPGDDIVPFLEGVYLSLDKTNRKREASKVTRNRRNLTKKMHFKIDTLTMEVSLSEKDLGITEESYVNIYGNESLIQQLREECCKHCKRGYRRSGTRPEHIVIVAVDRGEEGKVMVHYQNLLPEFKADAEP
eukprot:CAMPEP_0167760856 /NCGR_PEP_ID=MMETSP0110_2-20121227/11828_1 /TAXON_ID=629695 /ORGANISM="Gymnochlora sp., Strain CCMP2014" /LENGTH=626 /DNA_ID=CAMNT_0007647433 /DNA_START=161 /DNA_END=2041 /DNA_ORIENTATION=+